MAQYPYYGGWPAWGNEDQRNMQPTNYLVNAVSAYDQAGAARSSQVPPTENVPHMLALAELDPLGTTIPMRPKKAPKGKKPLPPPGDVKVPLPTNPSSSPGANITTASDPTNSLVTAPMPPEKPKKKHPGRRTTSHVWEHYYHLDERPGVVLCSHCDMGLRHDSTCTGTSSLQRHLERRHKIFAPAKLTIGLPSKALLPKREHKISMPNVPPTVATVNRLAEGGGRMDNLHYGLVRNVVIRDLRPLSVCLDLGLCSQLVDTWTKYMPMDTPKVPAVLHDLHKKVNDKILTMLHSLSAGHQLSLSWDVWGIGGSLEGFGGWSACWVTDQWELMSATLAVAPTHGLLPGGANRMASYQIGSQLAGSLPTQLQKPNSNQSQPGLQDVIQSTNAFSSAPQSLAVSRLQELCLIAGVRPEDAFMSVVGDSDPAMAADLAKWPGVIHARCGPMVLQRIPHQALLQPGTADPEIMALLMTVKTVASHFHRSVDALRELVTLQGKLELQRIGPLAYAEDGPWHHTYDMIATVCEAQPAIDRYSLAHPDAFPSITDHQWLELAQILGVLAPWKQAGDTSLRNGRPVMVSVYYAVFTLVVARTAQDTMVEWVAPGTVDMEQTMESDLTPIASRLRTYLRAELQAVNEGMDESQWQLLVVASALDPRFKRLNFIHATDRDSAWQLVLAAAQHQVSLNAPLNDTVTMETGEGIDESKRTKSLLEQAAESDHETET
eukprot:Ihof_evm1s292 gene=Ihof_evmTU1s292